MNDYQFESMVIYNKRKETSECNMNYGLVFIEDSWGVVTVNVSGGNRGLLQIMSFAQS